MIAYFIWLTVAALVWLSGFFIGRMARKPKPILPHRAWWAADQLHNRRVAHMHAESDRFDRTSFPRKTFTNHE